MISRVPCTGSALGMDIWRMQAAGALASSSCSATLIDTWIKGFYCYSRKSLQTVGIEEEKVHRLDLYF